MSDTNGSLDPKPWWRTRRAHSAPGPGGRVLLYCKDLTIDSPLTGAHLLDQVTLGFRTGSFTAILDPSGSRTHAFFFATAGLHPPSAGSIDLRASSGKDRPPSVGLLTATTSTSLDEALSVSENLLFPLSLTGASTLEHRMQQALSLTSLTELADLKVNELSPLDRFRTLCARTLVCGGDLLLVEDPTYLPTLPDRKAALELLPLLAEHGTTVILASASPQSCALAERAILLTNGRVTYDLLAPSSEQLHTLLAVTEENPSTFLGPIPTAIPHSAFPSEHTALPSEHSALSSEETPGIALDSSLSEDTPEDTLHVPWIPIRSAEAPTPGQAAQQAATPTAEHTRTKDSVSVFQNLSAFNTEIGSSIQTPEGGAEPTATPEIKAEPARKSLAATRPTLTPTSATSSAHAAPPTRTPSLAHTPSFMRAAATAQPHTLTRNDSTQTTPAPALDTPASHARTRHEDPDPITSALRALVADQRKEQPQEHHDRLPRSLATPSVPNLQQAEVIDWAKKILEDLPGPVIPD